MLKGIRGCLHLQCTPCQFICKCLPAVPCQKTNTHITRTAATIPKHFYGRYRFCRDRNPQADRNKQLLCGIWNKWYTFRAKLKGQVGILDSIKIDIVAVPNRMIQYWFGIEWWKVPTLECQWRLVMLMVEITQRNSNGIIRYINHTEADTKWQCLSDKSYFLMKTFTFR